MIIANVSPAWFFGVDVILEFAFAIVCMLVAIFAFKIYKKTSQRLVKYFGISFALISISYIIQSVLNFLIISKLNENVSRAIMFRSVLEFQQMALLVHMIFMTIGLSILLYTTFKDKTNRTLWPIASIALISIFFSDNGIIMFYIISSMFLIFITWNYIKNYIKNKDRMALIIALAFSFLFFGNVHFLLSVNHQLFYAIGHILELIAYLLILLNLYLVQKR